MMNDLQNTAQEKSVLRWGGLAGLLGVLGMSDQEWERAGERGELPSGEPEVASPVEQRSTATA